MTAWPASEQARVRALAGFAVLGVFWGVWAASLPRLQLQAGVTDSQLGTALLGIGAGALLSIRAVGRMTDRAEQATLPATVAALGVAGAVPVFCRGTAALSAAMLGVGACSGAVDAAINAAAVRAESPGRPLLSLAHGVFSVSVVAGSLAVAALTPGRAGRAWALVVVAGVLWAVATACAWLRVPAAVASPQERSDSQPPPHGQPPPYRQPPPHGLPRPLLVLGLLAAAAFLFENAWQSWGAIQLHASAGASLRSAALAPAAFALAAAAGRFAGHPLSSRLPPGAMFGAGSAAAAAGSAVAALATSPGWILAGIAVAGLGSSSCVPILIGIAGQPSHGPPGAATGTVINIAYLGFAIGPAATGLIAGALSLPAALLLIAAVAAALAAASPLLSRLR